LLCQYSAPAIALIAWSNRGTEVVYCRVLAIRL
jgi:hypothetical protein